MPLGRHRHGPACLPQLQWMAFRGRRGLRSNRADSQATKPETCNEKRRGKRKLTVGDAVGMEVPAGRGRREAEKGVAGTDEWVDKGHPPHT